MKIVGVSINEKALPTRKELVRMALNTKFYAGKHNALELINKEIDGAKLFKTDKPKVKPTKSSVTEADRQSNNNEQPKHNKIRKT